MKKDNKEEQLQKFTEKVLENIEFDREKADFLLNDIIEEIKKRKMEYKDLGPVAAKYLESLTRCNEQLVRLVSLLTPKGKASEEKLSTEDRDILYDVFQNEQNKGSTKIKKEKS